MLQLPVYQSPVNFGKFSIFDFLAVFAAVKPDYAWILAGLVGLFFVVVSLILTYHWRRFGIETLVMARASLIYFVVSSALLAVMLISTVVYIGSFS